MKNGRKEEKLLDILARERMGTALETALKGDDGYRQELKEQETAFNEMKEIMLDERQEAVVDRAISATNNCGAIYGMAAYGQGFRDGVKVIRELGEIA